MQFPQKYLSAKFLISYLTLGVMFATVPAVLRLPTTTPPQITPSGQQLNSSALSGAQALFNSSEFYLAQASVSYGPVGTRVTLSGSGFAGSSTVNFGRQKIKVTTVNPREISFVVPRTAVGRYDVSVTSGQKTSDPVSFMVTTRGASIPVIEKIEPATAVFGEKITITGRNFTKTDNIVVTSLGVIRDLKSTDGKTITFTIPLPEYLKTDVPSEVRKTWFDGKDNLYWNIYPRVVNTNGVGNVSPTNKFVINLK